MPESINPLTEERHEMPCNLGHLNVIGEFYLQHYRVVCRAAEILRDNMASQFLVETGLVFRKG